VNLILALTLTVALQDKPVTTTKEKEATVRIAVSGATDLDYVWRRKEITAFTGGTSGTNIPGASASENTFEGFAAIRIDATLSDLVFGVLEVGTKRVDGGAINYFNNRGAAEPIKLREAHVLKRELLMTELSLQLGITTWNFDLRGRGQSMAFDVRHSQRFNRNVNAAADGPGSLAFRASDPQEFEPVGGWLRYERDRFAVDVVALPAVLEGGAADNDECLYAIDLLYTMDSAGSRFGFILALTDDPGGRSNVFTYGGGVDYRGVTNLDAYVEFYFQNGRNSAVAPIRVGGYCFQVGAQYSFSGSLKPWVAANMTYFSGDGSATADRKSSAFNSYENINDLLILEDMYFGFDWDSNYRAFKVSGGIGITTINEADLKIWTMIGIGHTAKGVRFANETTRKLGNEIDLRVDWGMAKQFSLNLGVGFLFGSKVLEDSMGGPGAKDSSRQSFLYSLGMDMKF
jgi:hypothetical protein